MYYALPMEYNWPPMAGDAYATIRNCASCAATRGTLVKNQKGLRLFLASDPLAFVVMDLLRPRTKTVHGNQHVLVINYRPCKQFPATWTVFGCCWGSMEC